MNDDELRAIVAIEHALLGRIMDEPSVLDELPLVEAWDFVDPKSESVWRAIMNLVSESQPIGALTVEAELARMGRLESVGGLGGLAEWVLMGMAMIAETACHHAASVRQRGLAKRVRDRVLKVLRQSHEEDMGGDDLISGLQSCLNQVESGSPDDTVTIGEAVDRRLKQLNELEEQSRNGAPTLTGIPTGVGRLDALIGGWQIGIVQILCGRPAMGKSSALLASMDACSEAGFGAHLFTLEDSLAAHSDRAMSRSSKVPSTDIRAIKLNASQFSDLKIATVRLKKRDGWIIDERAGLTADEIVRMARKHAKKNKTKLVVVDYANLVRARKGVKDAHEALTEIITTFATSAKNDGFAYLVAAQLNRGVESRQDKRPVMSDLRESGSLEERAKLIVSVYRGSYYYSQPQAGIDWDEKAPFGSSIPKTRRDAEDAFERTVQLGVIKNNGGPTGTIYAQWDGPTTRIW